MVRLTEAVIRQKAEHHDGILADLEEISLHQLEIERIENIGTLCRKLQILYLQNNIIPKIENIHHLKDLRYLNLALNNITKIEGLGTCEFLNKLDLTVNFIDLDTFEQSIEHLKDRHHLRELYLMGNPALEWPGATEYVAAQLPQLKQLDGKEITRAERIKAERQLPRLQQELRAGAARVAQEKLGKGNTTRVGPIGDHEETDWSPETRTEMYREMAQQKAEKEAKENTNKPKERDYEREHAEAVHKQRAEGPGPDTPLEAIRQCNEGRWAFELIEEDGKGNVVLKLKLPRFMDSSLIDADVHPTHATIIVKGKVFRIAFPEHVKSDSGTAKRSMMTGELVLTLPKANQASAERAMRIYRQRKDQDVGSESVGGTTEGAKPGKQAASATATTTSSATAAGSGRVDRTARVHNATQASRDEGRVRPVSGPSKLADEMLAAALAAGASLGGSDDGEGERDGGAGTIAGASGTGNGVVSKSVSISGIVPKERGGVGRGDAIQMTEASSKRLG